MNTMRKFYTALTQTERTNIERDRIITILIYALYTYTTQYTQDTGDLL